MRPKNKFKITGCEPVSMSILPQKRRSSHADIGEPPNHETLGNLNTFSTENLFTTTTTKQNPSTLYFLGQRYAEIHKAPSVNDAGCFPHDRNLDSGFIGIGQSSGLRTFSKLNPQSNSYCLSTGATGICEKIMITGRTCSRNPRLPTSLRLGGPAFDNEPLKPAFSGDRKSRLLNLFL
jgi:hypothetical protein